MPTYRVFSNPPSLGDIDQDTTSFLWRTISSSELTRDVSRNISQELTTINPGEHSQASSRKGVGDVQSAMPLTYPTSPYAIFPFDLATLEAASQRITTLYKDVVFVHDDDVANASRDADENYKLNESKVSLLTPFSSAEKEVEISVFRGAEQTTMYTWPLSEEQSSRLSDSTSSFAAPSFLLSSQQPPSSAVIAESPLQTPLETQSQPESQSFEVNSFSSSIGRFPSFHFNLHVLTSLSSLAAQAKTANGKITRKVSVLLAALELEGPETIRIKNGVDAGNEVSIFKMILGDDEGEVCKLTAWREIADDWGGNGSMIGPKRGDIMFIENVTAICEPKVATALSASAYQKSTLTICYRTMPYAHEDGRLRPDLRLGESEPCVRKVARSVRWFEEMAGLKQ